MTHSGTLHTVKHWLLLIIPVVFMVLPPSLRGFLALPALIIAIVVMAVSLPLPERISRASIRLFMATVLATSIIQICSMFLWAAHIKPGYTAYIAVVLFVALASYALNRQTPTGQLWKRLIPSKTDALLVTSAVLMTGVILLGTYRHGITTVATIRSISVSMDDVSHLLMFNDEYRADGNLLLGDKNIAISLKSANSYPKGWHVVGATILHSADDMRGIKNASLQHLLEGYAVVKLFTYFLVSFALSFSLYALRLGKRLGANLPAITLWSLTLNVLFVIPLFWEGFYSFLPVVLCYLIFSALVTSLLNGDGPKAQDTHMPYVLTIYLSLLAAAGTLSWLLVAPTLFGTLGLVLLYRSGGIGKALHSFFSAGDRQLKYLTAFCVFIAGIAALGQFAVQLLYNPGSASILAESGGITAPPAILVILALLAPVILLLIDRAKALGSLLLVTPVLFLATAIWTFEIIKVSKPSYYFFKFEVLFVLLLTLIVANLVVYLVDRIALQDTAYPYLTRLVLSGFVIAAIVFGVGVPQNEVTNTAYKRTVTLPVAQKLRDYIAAETYSPNATRFVVLDKDQPFAGVMATDFARITHPVLPCDSQVFDAVYQNDFNKTQNTIIDCIKGGQKYTLLVSPELYDEIAQNLQQYAPQGSYELITL